LPSGRCDREFQRRLDRLSPGIAEKRPSDAFRKNCVDCSQSLGAEIVPLLDGLSGPPFELKDAYERAIERGLEVRGIVVPGTRDLTHPVDLVQENFPYLTP